MSTLSINDLPVEMLLTVADFCDIKSIRNFYVCSVYFEKTFTEKYVLFYLLKRIFKENQRYSNILFSRLGRSLVAQTLGNFYGINDPPNEEDPVANYLNHLN